MRRRREGYSFPEVLVVGAVLIVLVLIAVPRLVVPTTTQVRVPARQLAADLRLAQRLAIARHVGYLLEMSPAVPSYAQYTVRPVIGPAEPDFPKSFDPGISVTGMSLFQFRSDGTAIAGGSVTLASGSSTAVVQVVAATGRVTVTGP
jgi:type II secretory pathway pseudopilin PulG